MTDFAAFHRQSLQDRDAFWTEQAKLIDWHKPFDQVCDYTNPPFAKWFAGGLTNLCHNAVDRHAAQRPDAPALIWVSTEVDKEVVYSFAELQAEVKKFFDDIAPVLRAAALKSAPSTIGASLEEKFSEDELKVLIGWLESPVSKKYQQMSGEMQQALGQKVVADTRPQVEPKLKALEGVMGSKLRAAVGEPAAAASGAAKPAAPRASGPAKK